MEKMSSTSGKKRPASPMADDSRMILVLIKTHRDGSVTRCQVRPGVSCKEVFQLYCEKKDLHYKSLVFLYNGKRISKHNRAIEMIAGGEDEFEIDAMEHMPGGGGV